MQLGSAVPIFRVDNLDISIAYYVERLGFELQWRTDPLASVGRDRTSFMLSEGDQGQPGTWVWISAGDVDQLYEELQGRGALLRHPPTNYPWGSRECQVLDPDGHVLRFGAESRPGEPLGAWLDGQGRHWLPQPDGSWRAAD
jgi:catechol 2,3-dioxygenase-like lactoylglutathione lyase family enzyme